MATEYLLRNLTCDLLDRRARVFITGNDLRNKNLINNIAVKQIERSINESDFNLFEISLPKELAFLLYNRTYMASHIQSELNSVTAQVLSTNFKSKGSANREEVQSSFIAEVNYNITGAELAGASGGSIYSVVNILAVVRYIIERDLNEILSWVDNVNLTYRRCNLFGLGILLYLKRNGLINNLSITRYRAAITLLFDVPNGVSEPNQFFSLFESLLRPICIEDNEGRAFLKLPNTGSRFTVPDYDNVDSMDRELRYEILWPLMQSEQYVDFPDLAGIVSKHYYNTFNYEHYHFFAGVADYIQFAVHNVHRSWKAQIKAQQDSSVKERRLNYVSVLSDSGLYLLDNVNNLRLELCFRLLNGVPCPFETEDDLPNKLSLFLDFIMGYLNTYRTQLEDRWRINIAAGSKQYHYGLRQAIFVNEEQLRVINASDTAYIPLATSPTDIRDNVRIPNITYGIINADVNYQQEVEGKVIEISYPSGEVVNIDYGGNFYSLYEIEALAKFRTSHLPVFILSNLACNGATFISPTPLGTLTQSLAKNYVLNRPYRGLGKDYFKNALIKGRKSMLSSSSEFILDNDVVTNWIVQAYVNDANVNQESTLHLETTFPDVNAATLKLVSLFMQCYTRDVITVTNYASLIVKRLNYGMLGAQDEPGINMLDRISHGIFYGRGIGRNAIAPNKQTDIENFIDSNTYDVIISDADGTFFENVAYEVENNEIVQLIMDIIVRYYPRINLFLLIKVNALIPAVFTAMSTYFSSAAVSSKPIISVLRSQFSPYGSSECFLYIRKFLNGSASAYTFTDVQIANILISSGIYVSNIPSYAFKICKSVPKSVVLDYENLKFSALLNAGNFVCIKGYSGVFEKSLAFMKAICSEVNYGRSSPGAEQFDLIGVISLKRVLATYGSNDFFSVQAYNQDKRLTGEFSVLSEVRNELIYERASLLKSFSNGQRFAAYEVVQSLGVNETVGVIDVGGRDVEGIIFRLAEFTTEAVVLRPYTCYDPVTLLPHATDYGLTIYNEYVDVTTFLTFLNGNIVIAYNSLFMVEGQTSNTLFTNLIALIGAPVITCCVISFYYYDGTYSDVIPLVKQYCKLPSDGDQTFTFGGYNGCGYLTAAQRSSLLALAGAAGVSIAEVVTTPTEIAFGNLVNGVGADGHVYASMSLMNSCQLCWVLSK